MQEKMQENNADIQRRSSCAANIICLGDWKKIIIERKRKTYSMDAQYQKKSTLDLDLLTIYIYYW